jgi:hypothetical protein
MEVRKELVLNDEEITTIMKFSELVWNIINETGFDSSCVLNYLYECGADSYTHSLDDIENY